MRISRAVFSIILILAVSSFLFGCASIGATATAPSQTQTATVQRGNLGVDITASGNLALARTADLAFEIAGIVEEISVEAGNAVKEGQVVAKLDTTAWEDHITTLERQVTTAQRSLTSAERKVTTAQRAYDNADRTIDSKQRAVLSSEIALKNAEIALQEAQDTYQAPDIEIAKTNVDKAKAYLDYALQKRAESAGDATATWNSVVSTAQANLRAAEAVLNPMLTGADPDDIAIKKTQLTIAQGNLQDAKNAVEDAKLAKEDAKLALEDARLVATDARTALDDAQKALDKEKSYSPEIKAPFDGFVTVVNSKGGDEVKKGTIALTIADPTKFETEILVNEIDILKIKPGMEATIQANALTAISFPAKVVDIAPTATISSGVVNYKVQVELLPMQAGQRTQSSQSLQGLIPRQTQSGQSGQSAQGNQRSQTGQTGQTGQSGMMTQTIQLKQGLSITVSIQVDQRSNVLLVPNRAITRQGVNTTVQVMNNGVAEARAIKTGLSNYQNTEVTEGLNEGDTVIIPQTTTTSQSTQRAGQQQMMPIGPRIIR